MSTHEKLRAAGARLANCAYNLAKCARLNGDERRSLDEARRDWDAAIAAQPSPVVKQNLTTAAAQEASAIEQIAEQWDGCMYDSVGETINIGEAIRAAGKRLSSQPAAAQEAVGVDAYDDALDQLWKLAGGNDHPVYKRFLDFRDSFAAPVIAAPVDAEELARNRYRPVPDGLIAYRVVAGDGTRSLFSGTKDACNIVARKLTEAFLDGAYVASTPAAPGIDLEQFREAVAYWRDTALKDMRYENGPLHGQANEGQRLLDLIDASPKGDDVPHRDLVPGVMRCAKCAFQLHRTNLYLGSGTTGPGDSKTEPCPNGCGPLWPVTWQTWATEGWQQAERYFEELRQLQDSPKGGSEARDAARWRYVRRKLCLTGNGDGTCGMQAINLPGSIPGWPDTSDDVVGFCEAAIDAAMQAQAGDAEVQP